MNIKDFIADTLTQICEGIVEAQNRTEPFGACISPRMRSESMVSNSGDFHAFASKVSFDVAVEVVKSSEQTNGKPTFSIEIAGVSASLGNKSKNDNASINKDALRVQFDVPVCWPVKQFNDNDYKPNRPLHGNLTCRRIV